ncbi:epoxyqueuosine reductase [bacterium]|nr:epoxyqueuosine reductase [bacterium]
MKNSNNLTQELIKYVLSQGADLAGAAGTKTISSERNLVHGDFKYVIVAAIRLSESVLAEITDYPTKTYYHHYRTVNMALDQLALKIVRFLQAGGHKAFPVPASQLVDWEKQRGIFSHKHAAVEAGLGWLGRNNLLVTPDCGSQIRLVSVLTDAELDAGRPLDQDCGECRDCIDACPASAIADDPAFFDHERCYSQLDTFVRKKLAGQHICGICVKACSPSRRKKL